jgi:hypothetical protein
VWKIDHVTGVSENPTPRDLGKYFTDRRRRRWEVRRFPPNFKGSSCLLFCLSFLKKGLRVLSPKVKDCSCLPLRGFRFKHTFSWELLLGPLPPFPIPGHRLYIYISFILISIEKILLLLYAFASAYTNWFCLIESHNITWYCFVSQLTYHQYGT